MFIKKCVIFIFFIIFFQSCGIDAEFSFNALNYYPIIDSQIVKYEGNEEFKYNFYLNKFDGYITGKEIVNIYQWETIPPTYPKMLYQVSQFSSNQMPIIDNFYYYDDDGNFTKQTNKDNYNDEIILPNILKIDEEWHHEDLLMFFNDKNYIGMKEYLVVDQDIIVVPFGIVETYKIIYKGLFIAEDNEDAIAINGTMWVHPKIGIIKLKEITTILPSGEQQIFINELTKINWDI